ELPVGEAVCPACPQFPYFSTGQLGPWIALPDGAVMVAVAAAAPRLESGPDVVAGRIDRGPVLRWVAAVHAGIAAGGSPGFGHAVVPCGIGRAGCLLSGLCQLVSACAGATAAVAADHG